MPTDWKALGATLRLNPQLANLNVDQCKALIDAMLYLIYADHEASFLEMQEFEHLLHELPWALNVDEEIDQHVELRARQIHGAVVGNNVDELLQGIADQLVDAQVKNHTLRMAAAVAYSDWQYSTQEQSALRRLGQVLHVPVPFVDAIVEDIQRAHQPESLSTPQSESTTPMKMLFQSTDFLQGFFSDLFARNDFEDLDSSKKLALVDLLTIALVADGEPDPEELQEFKAQLERLPFDQSDLPKVRAQIEHTLEQLQLSTSSSMEALIQNAAKPFAQASWREEILKMAIHITHADLLITSDEAGVLYILARALQLEPTRVNVLIKASRRDADDDFLS